MWSECRELIDKIWELDPAAHSRVEIALCYPGFHAIILHRLAHWLFQKDLRLLAAIVAFYNRMLSGIEIHPGAKIGRRVFIDHGMGVVIGETSIIGDDVLIYQGAVIGAAAAGHMGSTTRNKKRHPTIGNRVIIGSGAKILGNIEISDGCRIGSGAIVLENIPADCLVVSPLGKIISKDSKNEKNMDNMCQMEEFFIKLNKLEDQVQNLTKQLNSK
jgi:serine O-acetyltransferase